MRKATNIVLSWSGSIFLPGSLCNSRFRKHPERNPRTRKRRRRRRLPDDGHWNRSDRTNITTRIINYIPSIFTASITNWQHLICALLTGNGTRIVATVCSVKIEDLFKRAPRHLTSKDKCDQREGDFLMCEDTACCVSWQGKELDSLVVWGRAILQNAFQIVSTIVHSKQRALSWDINPIRLTNRCTWHLKVPDNVLSIKEVQLVSNLCVCVCVWSSNGLYTWCKARHGSYSIT